MRKNWLRFGALPLTWLSFYASGALAQESALPKSGDDAGQIVDIVVTATKVGSTALQRTPIAIAAFSGDALKDRGVSDVNALVRLVPGLQTAEQSGYSKLYIRGVGSNSVFVGSDPSSTMHIDGVYLARPLSYLSSFLDVERVEVVKGPQGTLYGRNSVGGTINVISKRPSEKASAEAQVAVGSYHLVEAKAYVSGPVTSGGIRASIAASRQRSDGFLKNISTGNGLQARDEYGVRGQLLIPAGPAEIVLRADYAHIGGALGTYPKLTTPIGIALDDSILGDFGKISTDAESSISIRNYGFMGEVDVKLADAVDLKSITAYRALRSGMVFDADSSSISRGVTGIYGRQHQISQELNLTGNFDNWRFILGAFFFQEKYAESLAYRFFVFSQPPSAAFPNGVTGATNYNSGHLTSKSYALFGQAEYDFSPQFSAIVGGRITREKKSFDLESRWTQGLYATPAQASTAPPLGVPFFNNPFSVSSDQEVTEFTPKVGVNFKPSETFLAYASVSRGFKSGGYDFGATNPADAVRGFGPEYLWAYTAGLKADWLGRRLRTNVEAFYYDYSDLQVKSFVPPANAITTNAASVKVKGIELETQARIMKGLDLYASVAWLDGSFSRYPTAFVRQFGNIDASGKRLTSAPEWSGTLGGTFSQPLSQSTEIVLGTDYHFQSVSYFTAANDGVNGLRGYPQQQKAYDLLDARLMIKSKDDYWSAALIGSNLLNEHYVVGTADYTAGFPGTPGAPRVIRVQLGVRF